MLYEEILTRKDSVSAGICIANQIKKWNEFIYISFSFISTVFQLYPEANLKKEILLFSNQFWNKYPPLMNIFYLSVTYIWKTYFWYTTILICRYLVCKGDILKAAILNCIYILFWQSNTDSNKHFPLV